MRRRCSGILGIYTGALSGSPVYPGDVSESQVLPQEGVDRVSAIDPRRYSEFWEYSQEFVSGSQVYDQDIAESPVCTKGGLAGF